VAQAAAYDPNHASVLPACSPMLSSCNGTWDSFGSKLTLPCSVASGHLPLGLQLPLLFEGNYDLCETFDDAHFCYLGTSSPLMPLVGPFPYLEKGHIKFGTMMYGPLKIDQCVSKQCHADLLKIGFDAQVDKIVSYILNVTKSNSTKAKALAGYLKSVTQVKCVPPVKKMDWVGILTNTTLFAFLILVVIATVFQVFAPEFGVSKSLVWFAANRNGERLVATIPGDFNAFNGIRFLSMCWVITGHTVLQYISPVNNPTSEAKVTQSFGFTFIRGAEFAVDTFFFMSGFLATWGMVKQFSNRALTPKSYIMVMLARWLRLTPTYAWVLLFFWKVLPQLGTGPYWNLGDAAQQCEHSWWANMLYINNIVPWDKSSTMTMCMGWSWYLANDFQFFLLVPIIVHMYLKGERSNNPLYRYGPCLFLIILQLVVTGLLMGGLHDIVGAEFQLQIYSKPWCRMSPYVIGIFLALIHHARVTKAEKQAELDSTANPRAWKVFSVRHRVVLFWTVAAVALLFGDVTIYYDMWKCKDSEHQCNAWMSIYLYGFFKNQNWSISSERFYAATQFVLWTAPLALFCYTLFSANRYDIFKIKWLLSHSMCTPLARLTYNAYLVHLPLMMYYNATNKVAHSWNSFRVSLECIAFIVLAYMCSFILYLLIEKPVMNMVSAAFTKTKSLETRNSAHETLERQYSTVSDLDSEAVAMTSPFVQPVGEDEAYSRMEN